MILRRNMSLKAYRDLTVGRTYEHIGATFLDDKGNNRLVSDFAWKVLPLPVEDEKHLKASETQIGGDHYTSMGLQPLEATYRIYGYQGLKAAIFTKVMKYINRNKDNEVEQLKKARHCIDLLIEKAELENDKNS